MDVGVLLHPIEDRDANDGAYHGAWASGTARENAQREQAGQCAACQTDQIKIGIPKRHHVQFDQYQRGPRGERAVEGRQPPRALKPAYGRS